MICKNCYNTANSNVTQYKKDYRGLYIELGIAVGFWLLFSEIIKKK